MEKVRFPGRSDVEENKMRSFEGVLEEQETDLLALLGFCFVVDLMLTMGKN